MSTEGQMEFDLGTRVELVFPLVEVEPPTWFLPPFSGRKTRCAKCGLGAAEEDVTVNVTYHKEAATWAPCYTGYISHNVDLYTRIGFPEHLDRRCTVCGNQWVEATASLPGGGSD